ncbi:MAG: response regulator [Deltaproteobacteria bacterium]|nr:response regulator [Deltaproteobacteria bacterium]
MTDHEQPSQAAFELSFRTLADNAPWAILLLDDDRIAYANAAAAKLTGRASREALVGASVASIFHPEDAAEAADWLRSDAAVLEKPQIHRLVWPGGEVRQVETRAVAMAAPASHARAVILNDVHEQWRIREQLERTERLASLGRLAAGVAHEINNPAAAIMGNVTFVLEELEGRSLNAQIFDALNDSLEAVRRIAKIVHQLKLSTRSATVGAPLSPVSVLGAVNTAVRLLAVTATETTVEVDIADDLRALADEVFLGQVLNNLLTNALQAARPGAPPRVTVRARVDAERVYIEVEDQGTGMDEVTRKKIFEPFFTTKPVGQGTGLGLSVTQGLLRTMGGEISVESELGQGSRFTIDLKRAETAPVVPVASKEAELPDPPLMLLIDDDPLAGRGIARQLRDQFHVMLVEGIEPALEFIAHNTPDIILCDVVMPDGGAERFLELIRERHPELVSRVVITTGEATNAEHQAFVERATNPMVAKPLSRSRLNAVWKQVKPEDGDSN